MRAELLDRYGPIPPPVENLLAVARFKVLCRRYGVTEVSLQGNVGAVLAGASCPSRRSCGCSGSTTSAHYKPAVVDDVGAAAQGRA